jgi:hypothetical protein
LHQPHAYVLVIVDPPVRLCGHSPSLALALAETGFADIALETGPSAAGSSHPWVAHAPSQDLSHASASYALPFPFDASVGHQIHREGPARRAYACPAQIQPRTWAVDPTKADLWAPSGVVAVAAVAVVVAVAVAVVGTATAGAGAAAVAVAVAAVAVVVVVAAAAAAVVVAAAAAVAAAAGPQDSEWPCVGAYDRAGTARFWVIFGADKSVSDKLTNVEMMTGGDSNVPLHQERCYFAFLQHVVVAWIAAVASVAPSSHDFAFVLAR